MPRGIKFRAWYSGKMLEVGQMDFFSNGQININGELVGAKVMEFSGLKDCKGVDIFEGDVLRLGKTKKVGDSNNEFVPVADYGTLMVVYFDAGCFMVSEGVLSDILIWQELEVVGNIHENKLLVK